MTTSTARLACLSRNFQLIPDDWTSICSKHSQLTMTVAIDVFAAPRSKFPSEDLNIDALDALFNIITKRYDLIFIDHPLNWFSWTTQVVAASDAAVITGINTIPCLRQISETLALVRSSGPPALQIGIVLNRCERTLFGSVARQQTCAAGAAG